MAKFPVDAPLERVLAALQLLGFQVLRRGNHIALARQNRDGSRTAMTLPGHRVLKGSTLRTALTQAQVPREDFLQAFDQV